MNLHPSKSECYICLIHRIHKYADLGICMLHCLCSRLLYFRFGYDLFDTFISFRYASLCWIRLDTISHLLDDNCVYCWIRISVGYVGYVLFCLIRLDTFGYRILDTVTFWTRFIYVLDACSIRFYQFLSTSTFCRAPQLRGHGQKTKVMRDRWVWVEDWEIGSQERWEMRVQRAVRGDNDICDPLAVQMAAGGDNDMCGPLAVQAAAGGDDEIDDPLPRSKWLRKVIIIFMILSQSK